MSFPLHMNKMNPRADSTSSSNSISNSVNPQEEDTWVPPDNFAMVERGIYRSGFPKKKNFPFLKKLGIKSVIYLCLEEYPKANIEFLHSIGAKLHQCGVAGNKEPFVDIPEAVIRMALNKILDPSNHPLLIHCNKGKHRTGSVVGCLRKIRGWSLTAIFDEYRRFSFPKSRFMDQQFIELFNFSEKTANYDPELREYEEIMERDRKEHEGEEEE